MMPMSPDQMKQMAAIKQITQSVKAVITVNYADDSFIMQFTTKDEQTKSVVTQLLKMFSDQTATQLSAFFGIKGELIEVSPPNEHDKT